ncbi:MAG: UDP-2,4-diacetamido-2,4,6-trideoxy-beta-L-altropyranose hydrolase, partial [Thermodesulfobacteriota bacterium]|nr:UDP-2,4-diacetamido-2,4,6-trideoxy-beta-L-altropyranose hydrolase [Thermodesulfobacteriota bacterium]
REFAGNLCGYIEEKGYIVHRLPVSNEQEHNIEGNLKHAVWLGVDWQTDARQVEEIIKGLDTPPDWLVVDHYALDERWEGYLRPYCKKIMVIDDLADRPHDCDLLLDQNFYENLESRYDGLVTSGCKKLLGPKYALLRPEFREARKNLRKRDGHVKRIMIFFGGSDPTNETAKALGALRMLNRPDIVVDVVVGSANPHKDKINELCAAMSNVAYHCQAENMAHLMADADLFIGSGGSTTWERCCLGLPCLVISIAAHQNNIIENIADAGGAIFLGQAQQVTVDDILAVLKNAVNDKQMIQSLSQKGIQLVDGFGIERVKKVVELRRYKIAIVSDTQSWVNEYIPTLVEALEKQGHTIKHVHDIHAIPEGDFAFYLGCGQLVPPAILAYNRHNLVVHESALPKGKGWSPLTWQILEGKNKIPITLFEAVEKVDDGTIYLSTIMKFQGTELVDELRKVQAETSIQMCLQFVEEYPDIVVSGIEQFGESTYYPRRGPDDSRLDIDKSLREQLNMLRVVDNERYPAFFEIAGERYFLKIEKAGRNVSEDKF